MMMADFGADVVKVERPEGGDPGRGGHMADGKAPSPCLTPPRTATSHQGPGGGAGPVPPV